MKKLGLLVTVVALGLTGCGGAGQNTNATAPVQQKSPEFPINGIEGFLATAGEVMQCNDGHVVEAYYNSNYNPAVTVGILRVNEQLIVPVKQIPSASGEMYASADENVQLNWHTKAGQALLTYLDVNGKGVQATCQVVAKQ